MWDDSEGRLSGGEVEFRAMREEGRKGGRKGGREGDKRCGTHSTCNVQVDM